MNASQSILKLAFRACCFVLMHSLLNQNIGDGFEPTPTPNDPLTKKLDKIPKPPEFLMKQI